MVMSPDSELALGILSGTEFSECDSIRIVHGLYPHSKRYTFGDAKHSNAWKTLCEHYVVEVIDILGGMEIRYDGHVKNWGTVRCLTHAFMCGTSGVNNNWLSIHAYTNAGMEEARQHLIDAGFLPTQEQALKKRLELMNNRLALIASKNLRIGAEVISMFRCDTWAATIVDIQSDGFINILMDTGETKTVKPTTIQTK